VYKSSTFYAFVSKNKNLSTMPQLSCCVQITRGLLFALNIIFLLVGFTVMGLGIYIKTSGSFAAISNIYSLVDELEGEPMQWVGVGMIVAGILTVCLSAFGCLGMLKIKN
jgi:hypothetical protein